MAVFTVIDNEAASRIKQGIEKLIKGYSDLKKTKNDKEMAAISEANVRADYVDRMFGILGWDIGNPDEYDREHFIRGAGFADVALKLNNKPVIFVEAKRFGGISHSKDIKGDWTLVTNGEGNRRAIEELMVPFLVEVAKKETLEREIRETDDAIDKKVYALYGLTDDEIKINEAYLRSSAV
jgi:hypothetical protein